MRTTAVILALFLALPTACGGGGGGGSDVRLDGWWEMQVPLPSSTDPYAFLYLGPAAQSGQDVRYAGIDWTWDGNALRAADPDATSPNREEYRLTAQTPDLLEGDYVVFSDDRATSARGIRLWRRATPTGHVSGTGAVGGSVGWACGTAYAVVEEQPAAGGFTDYRATLVDAGPDSWTMMAFEFRLGPVSVHPLTLPATEQVTVWFERGESAWSALDGEVVFTELDAAGSVRGTYDLTFSGGGALQGEFDVPVRAVR